MLLEGAERTVAVRTHFSSEEDANIAALAMSTRDKGASTRRSGSRAVAMSLARHPAIRSR